MVLPPLLAITPEAVAHITYTEKKLKEVANEKLKVVDLEPLDATAHPSLEGTRTIIQQLQVRIGEEIILPGRTERDIATNTFKCNQCIELAAGDVTRRILPGICVVVVTRSPRV